MSRYVDIEGDWVDDAIKSCCERKSQGRKKTFRYADDFCSYGCRDSEKPNNSDVSKTKQAEEYPYNCNWDE